MERFKEKALKRESKKWFSLILKFQNVTAFCRMNYSKKNLYHQFSARHLNNLCVVNLAN